MICSNCQRSINGEGNRCPYCGAVIEKIAINRDDIPSARLNILSFFVPPLGVILYFKKRNEKPVMSHRCIESAIIGFLFYVMILVIFISTSMYFGAEDRLNKSKARDIYQISSDAASNYDLISLSDLYVIDKKLAGINVTNSWQCIGSLNSSDGRVRLSNLLLLSEEDLNLTGRPYRDGTTVDNMTCSSIRISESHEAEVLLVAKEGGRYYANGKVIYAFSSDNEGIIRNVR